MTLYEAIRCWVSFWNRSALRIAAVLTVALAVMLLIAFPQWPLSPFELLTLFTLLAAPSSLACRVLRGRSVLEVARILLPARGPSTRR